MCIVCFVKALVHVFKIYLTANYTYNFRSWPVDFRWDDVGARAGGSSHRALTCTAAAAGVWLLQDAALGGGDRGGLVYPGSMFLMTRALLPLLQQGQERLVERYHGRRAKLVARDGNEIDTMFMDRRQHPGSQGRGLRLVICCEGNAGFYEMGCLSAPLEAGYSVLGWNHPGFGGSTGEPFPQHDANAIDVVIKYALHRLRFPPAHVVIYGWSIGGFTATWATMSYPELGALVLDATFDDLVPLALKVMPQSWKGLVVRTVREHFNLNVAEQLCSYPGPVLLLRRTLDDVVSTSGHLVTRWLRAGSLAQEAAFYARYHVDDDWCLALLRSYRAHCEDKQEDEEVWGPHGLAFPWRVGQGLSSRRRRQLALFLARKHLKNVEATHCSPLEPEDFQLPWRL
ncbi:PREDICTED: abhydrolase domain-containing protein 16B [Myotis davidii]|uniref:abhydrolase domain-containing protein 16B n=1 Tax=Myotis davidii TaxID=225400 RepID=UPI00076795CD|nr:PREDICTED: abhydrolase domain-containing protein 16B [Myotis davidii]